MVLLGWVRQTPHVHGTSKGDMISDLEICRTAASRADRPRRDRTPTGRQLPLRNTDTRARRARGLKMHCHCAATALETVLNTLKVGTALRLEISSKPRRQSRSTPPDALSSAETTYSSGPWTSPDANKN